MSFRNTGILALLVALLAGYLYFVERPAVEKDAQKKTLVSFDAKKAKAVALTTPDGTIALERRADAWRITQPRDLPADPTAIESLLRAVAEADSKRVVEEKPVDLAAYGLDKPVAQVQITLESGETTPLIQVGKATPIGGNAYARRGDEAAVLLTAGTLESALKKSVDDLRDKTILEFADADAKTISTQASDGTRVTLTRAGEGWKLTEPVDAPADPTQVRGLLAILRSLRARGFVDEPADATSYGLEPPRLTVTIALGDETQDKRLLIGSDTPEKDKQEVYARLDGAPTVYTVGSHVLRNLGKSAAELRDKTVLPLDREAIEEVVVTRKGAAAFTLMRAGDAWTVAKATEPTETSLAKRFVDDVAELRGDGIVNDSGDLASGGLAEPDITIELRGKDAKPLGTIRLAQQGEARYASADGSKTVFTIADYVYRRFDKRPADFGREAPGGEEAGSELQEQAPPEAPQHTDGAAPELDPGAFHGDG